MAVMRGEQDCEPELRIGIAKGPLGYPISKKTDG